jgi:hypothetical protein
MHALRDGRLLSAAVVAVVSMLVIGFFLVLLPAYMD